jgi:hypothetical protein
MVNHLTKTNLRVDFNRLLYILFLITLVTIANVAISYAQLETTPIDVELVAIPIDEKVTIVATDTNIIRNTITLPDISLFGTEYAVGEPMTVWLQLLNSSKLPMTNSTCFVKVWYPNMTLLRNNTSMYYLDEGIFYLNLNAPNQFGVYPVSAKCYTPSLVANYSTYYNTTAFDNFETGTGTGGTGSWVNGWGFSDNDYCTISGANSPIGSYHMLCRPMATAYAQILARLPDGIHVANVSFWAKFNSIEAGEFFYFQSYNGTGWDTVRSWTDGQDEDDTYRRYEFAINSTCLTYGYVFLRFSGLGGDTSDRINIDNITVWSPQLLGYYTINGTEYQQVMSSGEIHVSQPLSNLNTNMSLATQEILDYIIAFSPQSLKDNHNVCIDNTTLLHILTYESCIGSRCFTYQKNETEICDFGCYTDTNWVSGCVPAPFFRYLWIIIIVIIIIVVFVIIYSLSSR